MGVLTRTFHGLAAGFALAALLTLPGGVSERWAPPLGVPLDIVDAFRAPPHPYAAGHRGFDLRAEPGAQILAPAGGVVSFSGMVVDRPVVSIRVDDHTVVSLEPVLAEAAVGSPIARGAPLGEIATGEASGGHCAGSCVHLGVRVDGEYVNPLRYFAGRPKLLPW